MQSTHTAVCLEGMAGHLWIKFLQKMLFLHSCLPPSLVLGTSKMCIHAERLIIAVSINNNNNNNNNNNDDDYDDNDDNDNDNDNDDDDDNDNNNDSNTDTDNDDDNDDDDNDNNIIITINHCKQKLNYLLCKLL